MRIGRAHGRLVIIDGDGLVDVAAVSGGEFSADPDRVFAVWDRFSEWAGRYAGGRTGPLVAGELGAPVLAPSQVFGIGLNYREHAAESGVDAPAVPPVFTKFRSCLAGPYAAVELPSDRVDWEVWSPPMSCRMPMTCGCAARSTAGCGRMAGPGT